MPQGMSDHTGEHGDGELSSARSTRPCHPHPDTGEVRIGPPSHPCAGVEITPEEEQSNDESGELPLTWKSAMERDINKRFYFNRVLNITQWERTLGGRNL